MGMRIHLLAAAGALAASGAVPAAWAQSSAPATGTASAQPVGAAASQGEGSALANRPPVRREVQPLPRRKEAKGAPAAPVPGQAAPQSTGQPAQAAVSTEAQPVAAPAWTKEEIAVAKAQCNMALYGVEAKFEPEEPIKEGACGSPHVVKLISVGRSPEVVLNPPATLTCDMVASLYKWMKAEVQPLARRELGGPIVKIETMSSYSCRNAYGRARTNLSEHGRANALDIGGFVTGSGDSTRVLASWGPTLREMRALAGANKPEGAKPAVVPGAQAPVAGAPAQSRGDPYAISNAPQPPAASQATSPTLPGVIVRSLPGLDHGGAVFGLAPASRLGGPKPKEETAKATPAAPPPAGSSGTQPRIIRPEAKAPAGPLPDLDPKRTRFLREAHTSACRYFGTVLGPEANRDHQNHFHLDMAPRKTGNYCH